MLLFLRGAEMQPERVRATWPDARFLARARLQPRPAGAVPPPAGAEYESWGILVETAQGRAEGEVRPVLTDDGRAMAAVLPPADDADPVQVLAAARYWELAPPYVHRLARLAAAPVEEYAYAIEVKDDE